MAAVTPEEIRAQLLSAFASNAREEIVLQGFHRAGVLVPFVIHDRRAELLLTKRTDAVETHKGQISFPGGMVDQGDRDILHTALREAHEELGIPESAVEPVGLLDDLATPTGFIITPVLGIMNKLTRLTPNPMEVAEVFLLPLEFFADPHNGWTELREFRGKQHEVWYYDSGKHIIWGATAMIIRSLLKKLRMA